MCFNLKLSVKEIFDFRDMFINSLFPAFLLDNRDMFINSLLPAALLDFKDIFMSSLFPKVLLVLTDFTDDKGSLRPDIVLMVTSSLIILELAGSWNGIPKATSSGCAPAYGCKVFDFCSKGVNQSSFIRTINDDEVCT